jgi:hypothetical protein
MTASMPLIYNEKALGEPDLYIWRQFSAKRCFVTKYVQTIPYLAQSIKK